MLFGLVVLATLTLTALIRLAAGSALDRGQVFAGRRKAAAPSLIRCRPKPPWVTREVIRLKALMPDGSCRTIADVFNRRFEESRDMTVRKSFVN